MIRSILCATLLSAGVFSPAFAAGTDGSYAVEGPGSLTCDRVTALTAGSSDQRDLALWLSGYITAHNRLLPETFDLTPWQTPSTLLALMIQYCTANPGATAEVASQELIAYLMPDRLAETSQTVMQRTDEKVTVLYEQVLERAIAALTAAGTPVDPQTGDFAAAVRRFQKQSGLPETGAFDQATLALLLQ
ncbi:peptidoglycan-binding domain-containing protein [uncultured Roseobacter sp.]|uniref:peptidoglycan-binding domain-containing protein n=1 Tax=uncultured Roseobacter sp. TaxID=114847 RepID=UPI002623860E|nr:peptidoglycan-binding domain-containing protein [uncultured Roseobacter sp.]